jgi:hypothetical protein
VIGFGTSAGVRVQFFTPLGTLWRLIDYDFVDARLWRWITVDYQYPSDSKHWQQNEFAREIETSVRPDGTGDFTIVDTTDPTSTPTTSSVPIEVPVRDSYWLDRPAFGDWDRLADPGPSAWEVAGQPVSARMS